MARSKQDSLFSLPYVHRKRGKPFVRLNYKNERTGKWESRERRVSTIEEAIAAYEDLRRGLGDQPKDYNPDKITFDELMSEFRKAQPKMPEWYLKPMEGYFGKRKLKSITYGDLKEFKALREAAPHRVTGAPRKPSTINREMEALREVLLYAVRHEWLAKNPFTKGPTLIPKSEEQSRSRVPSPEEEAAILAHCIGPRAHLRPILIGLRDTGLRKSALLSLAWKSVDLEEGFLEIPKGKANKGRPKVIAMTARLRAELARARASQTKDGKPPPPGAPIFGGIKDFKRAYGNVCRLAGVRDLHIHDWRHGFATDLMEANVEERLAMRATGHANIETHAIYTNIDKRLARVIADNLDKLHETRERASGEGEHVTDGTGFVS